MATVVTFGYENVLVSHAFPCLGQASVYCHPVVMLLMGAVATLLAAAILTKQFIVMALVLMVVGACGHVALTVAAMLLAILAGFGLVQQGVLALPPATHAWSNALFYGAFFASLLPGCFLAARIKGRRALIQQLQTTEQRLHRLYARTPAMLQSNDRQGRLISVSDAWLQTLGFQRQDVLGRRFIDFLTPASALRAREVIIPRSLRDGRCDDVDLQAVTRDGRVLDVRMSLVWEYDEHGEPDHTMAVLQDVTESNQLVARSHFAEHDPLTGLPNRVLLKDRLDRICAHHLRHGGTFAVAFLDLDHFKAINDTHGHEAGDALLKTVARRLQLALRASDTVCRLAGDEFVLLFTSLERSEDLAALAEKVLAQVATPCQLGSRPDAPKVDVACSMGVAVFPQHGGDTQTLLNHADQAMYRAKSKGRNRCEFFAS